MAKNLLYNFARPVTGSPDIDVKIYWDTDVAAIVVFEDFTEVNTGPSDGLEGRGISYEFCRGTTRVHFVSQKPFPYALKIETLDSPVCAVKVCDLAVVTPVVFTPASDVFIADGTVTVSYTGTVADPAKIRYSLDNTVWQAGNFFTGVLPGNLTVYIRDEETGKAAADWCRAQANFTLTVSLVYGKRYELPFFSVQATPQSYELAIYKKNYKGQVSPICGDSQPMKLDYQDTGTDKYHVLNGAKADINLMASNQSQFIDFFTSDERDYRIDILKAGALLWRGFLLPEIYSEDFIDGNHVISTTAADGLGTLKNYPYSDKSGNPFKGERALIDIIFDCLDKLDLNIPVTTIIDIYETGMREATVITDIDPVISDPLYQAKADVINFQDNKGEWIDCEKVLTRCLESFGARIYQDLGKWIIESIDAKRKTCWAVTYNPDRTFKSYELVNPVVTRVLPNTGGLQFINGVPNRELIAAWKKTTVEAEYVKADTSIPDGDFKDSAWNGNTLKNFTATAAIERVILNAKEGKNAVKLLGSVQNIGSATSIKALPFNIVLDATEKLHIKIKYKVNKGFADNFTAGLYFQLSGGGFTLTGSGWVASTSSTYFYIPVDQLNSVVDFEYAAPPVPATGDYSFTVYQVVYADNVEIHHIGINPLPGGFLPLGFTDSIITNKRPYTFIPETKKIYFVDTQETTNYKQVHRNYLSINGKQSKNWHYKGETGNNKLINMLASNMAYNYSRPTHVLRGALQGNIGYFNTIKEPWDDNRLFIWNGLSIDFKSGIYSGTLIELIAPLSEELLYVDADYVDAEYV